MPFQHATPFVPPLAPARAVKVVDPTWVRLALLAVPVADAVKWNVLVEPAPVILIVVKAVLSLIDCDSAFQY